MSEHLGLRELLERLVAAEVRFVVIGGLAVNAWGHVRATRDLDLVPAPDAANAGRGDAARKAWATRRRRRSEADVVAAIREAQPPELAERMITLYEYMRDAGAEPSWGQGEHPSVTMWLGKSSDPDQNNPVSVSFFTASVSINFTSVRTYRTPAEMTRLVELARQIPGMAPYLDGIESKNYGMHTGIRPEEILPSDEALATFQRVVLEASRLSPEDPLST